MYAKTLDEEYYAKNLAEQFDSYLRAFYSLPKIAEYVRGDRYREIKYIFLPSMGYSGEEPVHKFNKEFLGVW